MQVGQMTFGRLHGIGIVTDSAGLYIVIDHYFLAHTCCA